MGRRGSVRIVWGAVGHDERPRFVGFLAVDKVNGEIGLKDGFENPGIDQFSLRGEIPSPGFIGVIQAVPVAAVEAVEVVPALAAVRGDEAGALGAVHVPFADVARGVARVLEAIAKVVRVLGEVEIIGEESGLVAVEPGHEGGAGRTADGMVRIGTGEFGALRGEAVEVGGADIGVTAVAEGLGPPLVGEEEKEVGLRGGNGTEGGGPSRLGAESKRPDGNRLQEIAAGGLQDQAAVRTVSFFINSGRWIERLASSGVISHRRGMPAR